MPASSWARSSLYIREKPSEAARRPSACCVRSGLAVSAPRTITARRCKASEWSPNSSIMVSKVQVSPRWLQNTSSMSKGVALNRSATASTSDAPTNKNTALGSTKRWISHGQAIRSTLGRARDPDGPCLFVAGRKLVRLNKELATFAPGVEAALQRLSIAALMAQPRGNPLAKLGAFLATHENCAVLKLVRSIGDGGG